MTDRRERAEPVVIQAIAPGTHVTLAAEIGVEVPAIVTAVSIRIGPHLEYELAWWHDGQRFETWVDAAEILNQGKSEPLAVGFGFA